MSDLEFFFDPVCPFCWVTSRWVRTVQAQRDLAVTWRPISLALLNQGSYDDKPQGYPAAHHRGLQLLRVAAAAREAHGSEVLGPLYDAMGAAVWNDGAPAEDFDHVLAHTAQAGDITAILRRTGLPEELAAAVDDPSWDDVLWGDTTEALARAGDDVGTPILSFDPPDGPAFFGPVISEAPEDPEQALALWDAVTLLGRWPGFAELKRSLRHFPATPVTARLAGTVTTAS